ncbi:MAG: superoxide dismutase family protein [FCB group bacterium]|jgi:Cu-Zn family superoxide dismutase|nr:superoxide dismutase family protein [FCB group bacterium]
MKNRNRITLVRAASAALSIAALAFIATVAAPSIYAQDKPAPSTPPGSERTKEITDQATHEGHNHAETKLGEVTKAIAVITPFSGSSVKGQITFTQTGQGVHVTGRIEGLTPGTHGFHVHEFGDLSSLDATSAGGHYNPGNDPHAAPDDSKRHVGDLGNVEADASGVATYDRVDESLDLNGARSIVGRSVVVHANPDDLKSQPAGNAGPRVGAGVIGIAKP